MRGHILERSRKSCHTQIHMLAQLHSRKHMLNRARQSLYDLLTDSEGGVRGEERARQLVLLYQLLLLGGCEV
jgi:hypothetical protein